MLIHTPLQAAAQQHHANLDSNTPRRIRICLDRFVEEPKEASMILPSTSHISGGSFQQKNKKLCKSMENQHTGTSINENGFPCWDVKKQSSSIVCSFPPTSSKRSSHRSIHKENIARLKAQWDLQHQLPPHCNITALVKIGPSFGTRTKLFLKWFWLTSTERTGCWRSFLENMFLSQRGFSMTDVQQ